MIPNLSPDTLNSFILIKDRTYLNPVLTDISGAALIKTTQNMTLMTLVNTQ
jgi:hypothetical protein